MLERDVEAHLVKRVKELGGECRKVKWIGRVGAPDRLVMLPGGVVGYGDPCSTWVELKAPGKAVKFPSNAHERTQDREHKRMRAMGQQVVVIDSIEGVEELLK